MQCNVSLALSANLLYFGPQTAKNITGILTHPQSFIAATISPVMRSWMLLKFHTGYCSTRYGQCSPIKNLLWSENVSSSVRMYAGSRCYAFSCSTYVVYRPILLPLGLLMTKKCQSAERPKSCTCQYRSRTFLWFLPHDAMQSAVMRLYVVCLSVCLSVCDVEVWFSHMLEYVENNITAK